jgi:2-methylcitrate dehydratase PrpD
MADAKHASARGIERLAHWASGVELADLPRPVVSRAARILADNLSAIIAARGEPEVTRFHDLLQSRTERREATLFRGGARQVDRTGAAVGNGLAAEWLELAEGYRKVPCHAGAYVVPVLLAECEADNRTVGELLRALVLGYELVTRIARGWTPAHMLMQPHARYASIGAAAAVALVRRLKAGELLLAFTGACTLALSGPRNHAMMGALVRNTWTSVGAWCGLMSADWARCGIGGVAEGPYDVFSEMLKGTAKPEELTAGLGESWAVLDGYAKIHACCQHAHSAVEATQALRAELVARGALARVARVQVETHAGAMVLTNTHPATTLATKFSVPHIIAATLLHGEAGVAEFTHQAMNDPEIGELRQRVDLKLYEPKREPPNDRPARVTAVLQSGETLSAECLSAQGGPDRPFSDSVLWKKIVGLAAPAYPGFGPVFEEIVALEKGWLERPWAQAVARLGA